MHCSVCMRKISPLFVLDEANCICTDCLHEIRDLLPEKYEAVALVIPDIIEDSCEVVWEE